MPRFAGVLLLSSLVTLSAAAPAPKPSLPPWFPAANGLYEIRDLKAHVYDQFNSRIDHSTLPHNSGGYVPLTGKVWTFSLSKPKPEAWASIRDGLLRQGFRFVHGDPKAPHPGSVTLQKGDGAAAVYVAFWQCCDSMAIVEPGSNPFHVTLTPPAKTPETFGPKDAIPYVAPIAGSTFVAGRNDDPGSWREPGCQKRDDRGTAKTTRTYEAPAGISDFAVLEAYEKAFRAAGWDEVCRTSGHEMDARYTKNGRDIGVYIASFDSAPRYEVTVVDTGAGLRAELKKNCKASLYGVNFDFNKATLRPDADPALNQVLSLLKDEPKLVIEIGGHTDNVGTAAYNLKLSDERAAAVRQWLIGHGITAARLTSHGYGDTQPLVPNTNDENRARNRRVEVKRTDCRG